MDCSKIIEDVLYECDNPPVAGIKQKVVLINKSDILEVVKDNDPSTGKHRATITLKEGKTGYFITGPEGSKIFTAGYTPNVADDQPTDFTQTVAVRVLNHGEKANILMNSLSQSGNVVAIVSKEQGYYEIYGLDAGLKLTEGGSNSNENKGALSITLASKGIDTEPKTPYIYFDTDEATTEANFENKLSAIV